jgi:hypothetical protein
MFFSVLQIIKSKLRWAEDIVEVPQLKRGRASVVTDVSMILKSLFWTMLYFASPGEIIWSGFKWSYFMPFRSPR